MREPGRIPAPLPTVYGPDIKKHRARKSDTGPFPGTVFFFASVCSALLQAGLRAFLRLFCGR